jgi:hypothetical protein
VNSSKGKLAVAPDGKSVIDKDEEEEDNDSKEESK